MQFGSVGRSNGVEAIVDQILAIEKTRDKLFNLKSNLKQLSSEKKQKLDEMLVHLSEEKSKAIQKIACNKKNLFLK